MHLVRTKVRSGTSYKTYVHPVQSYRRKDGAFAVLFAVVTDAWFEGRGPDLAERGRTKEGLRNRHKVGILLLCNEHGYPLRWKTLPGRDKDPEALCGLVSEIEAESWVEGVPIVFDRAMGPPQQWRGCGRAGHRQAPS
jgi:hypothetical protein